MTVDFKNLITLISVATALVGVFYSIYNSRKTIYINSVTTSRLKYMDNLRQYIAEFCGLSLHVVLTKLDEKEKNELIQKIDKFRFLIKLHLNRKNAFDKRIIEKINSIPNLTDPHKIDKLEEELNQLVNLTQDILDLEWNGIKNEAKSGPNKKQTIKLINERLVDYGK